MKLMFVMISSLCCMSILSILFIVLTRHQASANIHHHHHFACCSTVVVDKGGGEDEEHFDGVYSFTRFEENISDLCLDGCIYTNNGEQFCFIEHGEDDGSREVLMGEGNLQPPLC